MKYRRRSYHPHRSPGNHDFDPFVIILITGGLALAFILPRLALNGIIPFIFYGAIALIVLVLLVKFLTTLNRRQSADDEYSTYFYLEQLVVMHPAKFEHLVGWVFERRGWKVRVVGQSGDHGLDVLLKKDGIEAAAQVKRYRRIRVKEGEVRDFYGSFVDSPAAEGFFITTSDFTPAAKTWAQNKKKPLHLINGPKFLKMVQETDSASWKELLSSKILDKDHHKNDHDEDSK